ncbi:MAG: hypothetical protein AAGK74_05855 [Chloroflexota bacterium]
MTVLELLSFAFSLIYTMGIWILWVLAPIGGKWKNPLPVMLVAWSFVAIPHGLVLAFGEPLDGSAVLPPNVNAIAFWATGPVLLLLNVLWLVLRRHRNA